MKLKEELKKLKLVQDLIVLRRLKSDDKYKTWVDDYDHCHSIIKFQEMGNLNPEKILYVIEFHDPALGFFAYWRFGLLALRFAERYHLTPIINWTSNSPYYEQNGVNNIYNPFEYYYEQVSDVSIDDAFQSKNVSFYCPQARGFSINSYIDGAGEDFVRLNQKYFKLKKDIEEKINSEIAELIGSKKTLAVQVRGVEWGNLRHHPVPASLEQYTEKIDRAIELYGFEQIYLATDSEDTVDYLSNKYNGKIVFFKDVARASRGSKTLAIFDNSIDRPNNKFLLGYEVLRDMMTLSSCQGLIATYSNVSMAAEITKLGRNEDYEFKDIIRTKLNQTGMSANKAVELMKKGKFR